MRLISRPVRSWRFSAITISLQRLIAARSTAASVITRACGAGAGSEMLTAIARPARVPLLAFRPVSPMNPYSSVRRGSGSGGGVVRRPDGPVLVPNAASASVGATGCMNRLSRSSCMRFPTLSGCSGDTPIAISRARSAASNAVSWCPKWAMVLAQIFTQVTLPRSVAPRQPCLPPFSSSSTSSPTCPSSW